MMMLPKDAATLLGVNPKTVARWAREGKLRAYRTLGGHRRFRRDDVEALLQPEPNDAAAS